MKTKQIPGASCFSQPIADNRTGKQVDGRFSDVWRATNGRLRAVIHDDAPPFFQPCARTGLISSLAVATLKPQHPLVAAQSRLHGRATITPRP
ncbi:hypothetical protein [Streptomyces sp. NPDC046985]|uniref:hypothetical protein n=1 Tax=Streptomyces sp. NPDC046985 TaxID=3155377 RepID=UPI0033F2FEAE